MTARPKGVADWNTDVSRRISTADAWVDAREWRWREWRFGGAEPAISDAPDIVESAIKVSRGFLSLDDDWDGEGSVGYTEETWEASVALLRNLQRLAVEQGQALPAPKIGPAQEGSFDLHWELSRGSMLMNIESNNGHACTYYGHTCNGSTLAGAIVSPSDLWFIMSWITAPWEP